MTINLPKVLLESKNIVQVLKILNLDMNKARYARESLLLTYMASYALNKPKNITKPNFEDLDLIDIYAHLREEFKEVEFELKQKEIDYERLIDELSDLAAMVCGLISWVLEHRGDNDD